MSAREWLRFKARAGFVVTLALLTATTAMFVAADTSRAYRPLEQAPNARVRLVHGVAGAGPLDIYVDGAIALIGIVFGETSSELILPAGEHDFAVVPSGATVDLALAAGTITLREGAGFYVPLLGTMDAASVGLFAIDERPLDQGRARFRIISGVPDADGIVPIFAGGDALSEQLGFGDASEYAAIDAGTYDLDLLDAASGTSLLALPATAFVEGTTTDIMLIGLAGDGSLTALVESVEVDVARAEGRTAQIVQGTCSDAGEPIADLGLVQLGQGGAVGVEGAPPVAQGYGLAGVPFASLLAAPHAIAVSGADGASDFVACGEIGGQLTETGALVIALQQGDSGRTNGIAVLAPGLENPETTGVSVFLAERVSGGRATGTPEAATD